MWICTMRVCVSLLVIIRYLLQLKEYKVVGRAYPTDKVRTPPLYEMRIFATDKPSAKSRFWYFGALHKKMKKSLGEILFCEQVRKHICVSCGNIQSFISNFSERCHSWWAIVSGNQLQVHEKKPETIKNFGIWLRYQSRSGIHNMYREYRDLTKAAAVTACCESPLPL